MQVGYQTVWIQIMPNIFMAVDKVYQRIALAGKYLMLLKFNVYP